MSPLGTEMVFGRLVLVLEPERTYFFRGSSPAWEQERRELLDSIIEQLEAPRAEAPGEDAFTRETCWNLLAHLAGTALPRCL